ncbi:MAG: M28 family peptidase [Gemmatimonadaceae bacterium]|nr:M28 family peptidase [Gemmatimonadaceae bacterium]
MRNHVFALADDSMQGRRTGSEGARRAARYISAQMQTVGLVPAGDSGYWQRVPMRIRNRPLGGPKLYKLPDWATFDGLPLTERGVDANLIGVLRGVDPAMRNTAVIVSAHYDHHGMVRPVFGDSIMNGADDDASGVATIMELARVLSLDPPPKRSIVFLLTTGEELGMIGVDWYVGHPSISLERTVAALQVEMTGRPDTAIGGFGRAWLSGDDRSTLGSMLRSAGLPVVPDPRPSQRFFERSDNIAFARREIPAHTLSSFGLHKDYHTPADEPSRIDILHMTAVAKLALESVRILANGPPPSWNAGGKPVPAVESATTVLSLPARQCALASSCRRR